MRLKPLRRTETLMLRLSADLAGPQCYHQDDYSIFYNNIKDNVAKRVAAYKNRF